MLRDLWPIEPIRHLGIDLRFLKHKKVEDFKREQKIKKLMRKQLGDSSIWKNKDKFYKDRKTGAYKKEEWEHDYFFNDNFQYSKDELPPPKLDSWKYEEKDRPENDPTARSYKSEIVKIQREIAIERKNDQNNQIDLLNYFRQSEKPGPPPKPKLEEDALEKLWRPNIKRERMYRTGEVRIKYDPFHADAKDSDVDSEFLEEYKSEFDIVKPESVPKNEPLIKKSEKSEYFGGLVKLEKTKEEQAHLEFIEKIKEEEWKEQRHRELYGENIWLDIEQRSEPEDNENNNEQVDLNGEKFRRIDAMFKAKLKDEERKEAENHEDMLSLEEDWLNVKDTMMEENEKMENKKEYEQMDVDDVEINQIFDKNYEENEDLLEILSQRCELWPWKNLNFKEDLRYFDKNRRMSI